MENTHKELWEEIRDLKDNHLPHIQNELTEVKTNVEWLMKFFWIIATASIGSLIASIMNLIK